MRKHFKTQRGSQDEIFAFWSQTLKTAAYHCFSDSGEISGRDSPPHFVAQHPMRNRVHAYGN